MMTSRKSQVASRKQIRSSFLTTRTEQRQPLTEEAPPGVEVSNSPPPVVPPAKSGETDSRLVTGNGSERSERPPLTGFSASDSYSPAGVRRSVDPRPRHHLRRRPDPGGRRRGICHGVGACTHRPEAGAGSSAVDRNPDDDDDGVARAGDTSSSSASPGSSSAGSRGQSSESLSSPWRRRSPWISPSPQSFSSP